VEPGECGSFVVIGSDVQELGTGPLVQRLAADVGDRGQFLRQLGGPSGLVDEIVGDPVGLADQHAPLPGVLRAGGEHLRAVRPPQPFERSDDEVSAEGALAGELDREGDGVERLDGAGVVRTGVGVAATVDGDEPLCGHVDQRPVGVRRRVELLEFSLDVIAGHVRRGWPGPGSG
jgi:hypothetical protein